MPVLGDEQMKKDKIQSEIDKKVGENYHKILHLRSLFGITILPKCTHSKNLIA